MDLQLQNKVIIVTGGAKGIGESITRVLSEENAIPVIIGRSADDNEKLVKSLNKKAFSITAELTDPNECKRAVNDTLKEFNRIDGLVNNAGVNDGVSLENGSYQNFIDSLHKNLVHY